MINRNDSTKLLFCFKFHKVEIVITANHKEQIVTTANHNAETVLKAIIKQKFY